jgi:hypothetical protein
MCTSNVTIPTVTEGVRRRCVLPPFTVIAHRFLSLQCISSCSSMQRAQTVRIMIVIIAADLICLSLVPQICRDNTFCMCNIARPPDLEACFECILEGIGTFADSIPHYIESLQYQTSGRSFGRLLLPRSFFTYFWCSSLYCLLWTSSTAVGKSIN